MDTEFHVHCGYCSGEHVAILDTLTVGQAYGPIYNVHCAQTGVRWGVHAVTDARII